MDICSLNKDSTTLLGKAPPLSKFSSRSYPMVTSALKGPDKAYGSVSKLLRDSKAALTRPDLHKWAWKSAGPSDLSIG